MFPIEVFRATVRNLVTILDRHGARYHLTGGVTSVAYGEPRMTQDIDLVIDGKALTAMMPAFLESLAGSIFIHDPGTVRSAVEQGEMFQLIDRREMLKLDVYSQELIPGELERSVKEEVFEGDFLPLASRADTVLAKLFWINKGSHKSRRDLRYLYRNTDDAQREFIAGIAEQFCLTDLLAEVLAEPDEIR